ncbi:MAG: helix-turn-helix domain-containing protein [Bacteroidales bacterium]|nr:helix-turn-helix domain-containing protein [Bacteroidales bacterium]
MLRPYNLLENVLLDIENDIRNCINASDLVKKYELSERHLRRLFQFAFNQSLCSYIRSRKLAASLEDLLKTDTNVLNVAMDYGFDYEQSYIRAFKREFGITPGELRKNEKGQVIKVKPPLHMFDESRLSDGVLFGPDIVMVPQFRIIGKRSRVPFDVSASLAPELANLFWSNEHSLVKSIINPDVYIGFTDNINREAGYSDYMPSVMVDDVEEIPNGLCGNTFEASLCARFRYIGQHHYSELSGCTAEAMYKAICKFADDEQSKYTLLNKTVFFEKVDTGLYDGTYCQMEWFCPIVEKSLKS